MKPPSLFLETKFLLNVYLYMAYADKVMAAEEQIWMQQRLEHLFKSPDHYRQFFQQTHTEFGALRRREKLNVISLLKHYNRQERAQVVEDLGQLMHADQRVHSKELQALRVLSGLLA